MEELIIAVVTAIPSVIGGAYGVLFTLRRKERQRINAAGDSGLARYQRYKRNG